MVFGRWRSMWFSFWVVFAREIGQSVQLLRISIFFCILLTLNRLHIYIWCAHGKILNFAYSFFLSFSFPFHRINNDPWTPWTKQKILYKIELNRIQNSNRHELLQRPAGQFTIVLSCFFLENFPSIRNKFVFVCEWFSKNKNILMIGSFWNFCRACPSMPEDKVNSFFPNLTHPFFNFYFIIHFSHCFDWVLVTLPNR